MKTNRAILILITFWHIVYVHGQNKYALPTGSIVELEACQSAHTGTLIAACMERNTSSSTFVSLYRSTDLGKNWSHMYSIFPENGGTEIPDPVVVTDASGHFFVAVMRVNKPSNPMLTTADVEIYRSIDDGITWSFCSTPHQNDMIADYPQLVVNATKKLFLVYSKISGFPIITNSILTFKRSEDGGENWQEIPVKSSEYINSIGADMRIMGGDSLLITSGDRKENSIHVYKSHSEVLEWKKLPVITITNQEVSHITKPVTNNLSDYFGIISHKPHEENTTIFFHSHVGNNWFSQDIGIGAYAQGILTNDGTYHIIFNKKEGSKFSMYYIFSKDHGLSFSDPLPLFTELYAKSSYGEYQAFFQGSDGLLNVVFCDWSDDSKAKIMRFSPENLTGTWHIKRYGIDIMPNPCSDELTLTFQERISNPAIKIFDHRGDLVYSTTGISGIQKLTVPVNHFPAGNYILRVETGNLMETFRFLKVE